MIGKHILAGNTSHLWSCATRVCSLCGQHENEADEKCPEGHRMMDVRISAGDATVARFEAPTFTTGDAKGG